MEIQNQVKKKEGQEALNSLVTTCGDAETVYTLFFYKNLVYKNIKASNGPKIKNILRTYEGFKF